MQIVYTHWIVAFVLVLVDIFYLYVYAPKTKILDDVLAKRCKIQRETNSESGTRNGAEMKLHMSLSVCL